MNLALATIVVVAFAVLLERMNVAASGRAVAERATKSFLVLKDSALTDDEKELALRREAVHLFGQFGAIVVLGLLALLLPLGAVWLLDRAGWASMTDVLDVLGRVDFLVAATVIGTAAYYLSRLRFRK